MTDSLYLVIRFHQSFSVANEARVASHRFCWSREDAKAEMQSWVAEYDAFAGYWGVALLHAVWPEAAKGSNQQIHDYLGTSLLGDYSNDPEYLWRMISADALPEALQVKQVQRLEQCWISPIFAVNAHPRQALLQDPDHYRLLAQPSEDDRALALAMVCG